MDIDWESLEISIEKGKRTEEYLENFIKKNSLDNKVGFLDQIKFKLKFRLSRDKNKFLLNAYTAHKALISYNTESLRISSLNFKEVDFEKLIKKLKDIYRTKIGFRIFNVIEEKSHQTLLLRVRGKDKEIFKEAGGWKSGYREDYLLVLFYNDRLIIKDYNSILKKRSTARRIIENMASILRVSATPYKKENIDFKKFIKNVIRIQGIKTMTFQSENTPNNPILNVICRQDEKNISNALNEYINLNKLVSIDSVRNFSIKLPDKGTPLRIKIEHKLKNIDKDAKALTLRFSTNDFSDLDKKFLDRFNVSDNFLYYEKGVRNKLEDLERLYFKKQLNFYEVAWYEDLIEELRSYGLIETDYIGTKAILDLNKDAAIELLINIIVQNGGKTKILTPPKISRFEDKSIFLEVEISSKKYFIIFLKEEPTEKMLNDIKTRWVNDMMDYPPIFIVPNATYVKKLLWSRKDDWPFITLPQLIYSILEGNLDSKLEDIISKINSIYRQVRNNCLRKEKKNLRDIVNKKDSSKFREFEDGIYVLQNSLFTNTQKIGAGYLPDGIKINERKVHLTSNADLSSKSFDIWDAKIWFSNFNVDEEKDKMRRYILSSLSLNETQQIGKLRRYLFVGHLEDPKVIDHMFKEAKKAAKVDAKRFRSLKVSQSSIDSVEWKYIDFEFIEAILDWMDKQSDIELSGIDFYSLFDQYIGEHKIFYKNEADDFLSQTGRLLSKNQKKVDIKGYRDHGKSVKGLTDNLTPTKPAKTP